MPDILTDPPLTFQDELIPIPAFEDSEIHNEARQALLALNQLAFALRGAPGLTVRSVAEDGAVPDGSDQRAAIQTTLDTVAGAGGGIALVPPAYPNIFHWNGTITIPANVILSGLGDRSVLRGIPDLDQDVVAIRFA